MATRILVLATKNENLGASWPQDFFLKVEHCIYNSHCTAACYGDADADVDADTDVDAAQG